MTKAKARLKRLQRLERTRDVAKRAAAAEAAAAENNLALLTYLSTHAAGLAAQYAQPSGETDGFSLRHRHAFVRELLNLSANTSDDAAKARTHADAKQTELAAAERRRATVADHASRRERELARREATPPLSARGGFGTNLE